MCLTNVFKNIHSQEYLFKVPGFSSGFSESYYQIIFYLIQRAFLVIVHQQKKKKLTHRSLWEDYAFQRNQNQARLGRK